MKGNQISKPKDLEIDRWALSRERVVRKPEKPGTLIDTEGWLSCLLRCKHTFQSLTLEPSQRRATRRVKGPRVMSHEKLGMLSLEKIERKVTGISSNIIKLLHA